MPGNNDRLVEIARSLRDRVEAPVLGGVAVYLHGGGRATIDLDFYAVDRRVTSEQLRAAGATWSAAKREHVLDGVRIHLVTPEDAKHTVERTSVIDGVLVVSLKDLIAIKLICGLNNVGRGKDIVDVEDLIREIPLDKRFAGKLPPALRASFKSIVDVVRARHRALGDRRF
jgi:predicted nucleotidyltransferase component of viral defense system